MRQCSRCLEEIPTNPKLTSESEPYCSHCGYILGTSIAPSVWACGCGEVVLDHGSDERPHCIDCKVPMSCSHATASQVHGAGVDSDLDYGLAFLLEAQEVSDEDILFDMDAQATAARRRVVNELNLGSDSQS